MTGIIMSVTTRSGGDFPYGLQRGCAITGLGHLMTRPLEDPPKQEPLVRLIIAHQDLWHPATGPLRYFR
jgi:hypothetical protein